MLEIFNRLRGLGTEVTDKQIIEHEIREFKASTKRRWMLTGERYFDGEHDIKAFKRETIGKDGKREVVENLPNHPIVDNQYSKMVSQKNNYLLGNPLSLQCDNEQYRFLLNNNIFHRRFHRTLKNIGEDSLNFGIGWMFINYDSQGNLSFRRLKSYELWPIWRDAEHTDLEMAIRVYPVTVFDGVVEKIVEKVEIYKITGIDYYELTSSGKIIPTEPYHSSYFIRPDADGKNEELNWSKVPLIPFKYNSREIPLIRKVKSIQDGINLMETYFTNGMLEDTRSTILVLVNYDGQDLGEFRHNLATYGAVKVRRDSGSGGGGVETLQIEVNAENYKAILELFKKALIENAMGYDAKDDRLSGNPNQMNIQSMYSDIDLDANGTETEYQAAMEEVLWFVNAHLFNTGQGDFENEKVEITFNRDVMVSESEIIDNCIKSIGTLSDETVLAKHPWVRDPAAELDRLDKQNKELNQYNNAFADNKSGDE